MKKRNDLRSRRFNLLVMIAGVLSSFVGSSAHAVHSHNFVINPAMGKPTVGVSNLTPRAGEIIGISASGGDSDECTGSGTQCSFWNGYTQMAPNAIVVTAWSDNNVGGVFGKYVGSTFQSCPPSQVTHYKTPTSPQIVYLTVTVDDVNTAFDPATGNPVPTADDTQRTSDVRKITVWDFTIASFSPNFIPTKGGTVTLTATVSPASDHNGTPIPYQMDFYMSSSAEPGYCINATDDPTFGAVHEEKDLQIRPLQYSYIIVDDSQTAHVDMSQGPRYTASVTIVSKDYGSYGELYANMFLYASSTEGHTAHMQGNPLQDHAQIPTDVNHNQIADTSSYDGGGASGYEDEDPDPQGDGVTGDGLSRYEEYRGMKIQGTHTRLSLSHKEVFIHNLDNLATTYLTEANLGAKLYYIRLAEMDGARSINPYGVTNTLGQQKAIVVENGGVGPDGVWGATIFNPDASYNTPSQIIFCHVYATNILGKGPKLLQGLGPTDNIIMLDHKAGGYLNTNVQTGVPGWIKIDNEIIAYSTAYYAGNGIWYFSNLGRGSMNTTAANHNVNTLVSYFVDPADVIAMVFAHEAGHGMNLSHRPNFWEPPAIRWFNIMNENTAAGSLKGQSYWPRFRSWNGLNFEDALDGDYRVNLEP